MLSALQLRKIIVHWKWIKLQTSLSIDKLANSFHEIVYGRVWVGRDMKYFNRYKLEQEDKFNHLKSAV